MIINAQNSIFVTKFPANVFSASNGGIVFRHFSDNANLGVGLPSAPGQDVTALKYDAAPPALYSFRRPCPYDLPFGHSIARLA